MRQTSRHLLWRAWRPRLTVHPVTTMTLALAVLTSGCPAWEPIVLVPVDEPVVSRVGISPQADAVAEASRSVRDAHVTAILHARHAELRALNNDSMRGAEDRTGAGGGAGAMSPVVSRPATRSPPRLVNLNTASSGQLQRLPRVGPATARNIIAHRPYATVDELRRVPGIGAATLEQLRPLVAIE